MKRLVALPLLLLAFTGSAQARALHWAHLTATTQPQKWHSRMTFDQRWGDLLSAVYVGKERVHGRQYNHAACRFSVTTPNLRIRIGMCGHRLVVRYRARREPQRFHVHYAFLKAAVIG